MNKEEIAVKKFKEGYNCSQSILHTYAPELGLADDLALKVANGFGAGMGRKQEVCGAVTGSLMVIGLAYGRGTNDGKEKQENTYRKVQAFIESFEAEFGTVNCRELLGGCILSTEDGQKRFKEECLIEKCYEFVRQSCNILDKMDIKKEILEK